ncbi:MAG: hypothetical protein NZ853_07335 [Leptospiraceae bacterium]|nr:hypothetical protein [Leptospiraceae bacterium]MDW7975753.1 hypothetical protein [Leptospiraceae bacterium]
MKILFWFMVVLIFVNYCKTTEKSQKKEIKKVEIRCEKEIPMRYHYDTETGDILEKGPIILPQNLSCDQARKLPENEIMKFQRDGYWYLYHLGGKVMAEGMNKKNKREGEWKFYDEKGNLIKIILYSDGKKNGKEIGYFAGTNIVRYEGQNQDNKK